MNKELTIRSMKEHYDTKEALRAQKAAWGFLYPDEIWETAEENIKQVASDYPEGYLVAYLGEEGVGAIYSIRYHYDIDNPVRLWSEISAKGMHAPDGETIYVLSLGVSSKCGGMGIGTKLVEGLKEVCIEQNCKQVALGCRIPEYHKHTDIPVEEYITLKDENGEFVDRELRFYSRCGMSFIKMLPEYMSGEDADPDSLNYGVLSIWENPHYKEV